MHEKVFPMLFISPFSHYWMVQENKNSIFVYDHFLLMAKFLNKSAQSGLFWGGWRKICRYVSLLRNNALALLLLLYYDSG